MLEHGEKADAVQKQVQEQGLPFERWPKFLRERPTLLPGLDLFFSAFSVLSTCRSSGMGIGPIPYTAICTYCDREGFDDELSDLVLLHVHVMDSAFLRYHSSKMETSRSRR